MKSLKNSLKILSVIALFSLPASLVQANDDTPLGRYLECLNNQTKGNNGANSDRIANADKVLQACATERQAVLDSMPRETALAQLERIENHLKGREDKNAKQEDSQGK